MSATVVHLKMRGGVSIVSYDIYIGRAAYRGGWQLPKSKWANPFSGKDRLAILAQYREYVLSSPELVAALPELRGLKLGCWCVGGRCFTCGSVSGRCAHQQCHGEILVELLDELYPIEAATVAIEAATVDSIEPAADSNEPAVVDAQPIADADPMWADLGI